MMYTIYIFSVIPVANTVKVLILYRNSTNRCQMLIIYSDWSHRTYIYFGTYTEFTL